jgi:K+-sensing histidine kinase KdpD
VTGLPELLGSHLTRSVIDALTGIVLCAWFALTGALITRLWLYPVGMLFAFVLLVIWVSRALNLAGAVLGLAVGASVFSWTLFGPFGSFDVASAGTRAGLFWMLLCGSAAAYVFARPSHGRHVHHGGDSC